MRCAAGNVPGVADIPPTLTGPMLRVSLHLSRLGLLMADFSALNDSLDQLNIAISQEITEGQAALQALADQAAANEAGDQASIDANVAKVQAMLSGLAAANPQPAPPADTPPADTP